MGNRADRRAKKKQQPRWQKMTHDQRINAMCKNGISPKDLDDAYAKGYKEGVNRASDACMKDSYAAFLLAAHDVFGFGRKRCRRLLRAADERVCTSLASDEAVKEVFRKVGITINFFDPERITETLEGD